MLALCCRYFYYWSGSTYVLCVDNQSRPSPVDVRRLFPPVLFSTPLPTVLFSLDGCRPAFADGCLSCRDARQKTARVGGGKIVKLVKYQYSYFPAFSNFRRRVFSSPLALRTDARYNSRISNRKPRSTTTRWPLCCRLQNKKNFPSCTRACPGPGPGPGSR